FITSATVSSTTYAQVTRSFTPVSNGTYYFGIRINANSTPYYIGFDDFSLTETVSCLTPTTQASNISYTNTSCFYDATVNWTRGNGDACAVFITQGNAGGATPVDGTEYVANTTFGNGDDDGFGWYCIYNGTGTSVTVNGLNASTTYRVHICEYKCLGTNIKYFTSTAAANNPKDLTTGSTCTYCTGNSTICSEYISRVQVGTINNPSTCTAGGYKDYTALSTNMTTGIGYSMTVTNANGNGFPSDQCGIWIDWNRDGDFNDANETITGISGTPGKGPYTKTISPPSSASVGSTRMRVRIAYSETPYPCGTASYGEVEDYTINVASGACTTPGTPSITSTSGVTETSATFNWAAGAPAGSAVVSYYWAVGTVAGVDYVSDYVDRGITTDLSATSSLLSCNTTYYWTVKAYTSCNGTSSGYPAATSFTTSACPVVPANDQCAGAIAITCPSSTPGTTVGATTTGDPTATCGTTITAPGVWYTYTSTGVNDVTVSLCGSSLDTKLSIYTGACGALSCLIGEDDDYTVCGDNDPSITFSTTGAGTVYYLFVHGTGTSTGTFTINISCSAIVVPGCPTLTTPANGQINVGSPASLNWTAPTTGGAVSYYKLYFGTNNPPTNINNGINIGNVLTYSPPLSIATTYYWEITAVNSAGESAGCEIRHFTTETSSTLVVDNTTYSAEDLVNNYLVSGCLETKNIKFTGNSAQIGYFTGGSSTIGYYSGLVLSSGNAKDAEGPNNVSNKQTSYGRAGDSNIDAIVSPDKSNDASVLEFDFKPSSNTVSFRYVFASEEYNEYVNKFNDAFGFFLTGGSYTNKNIALIPGTSTPVTINNVNNGYRAAPDKGTGPCTNCSYYRDNCNGGLGYNVQCDGLTTVLTATASVTACNWYHIKLVVADVGDDILDSWVFLEANSFTSGDGITLATANPTATDVSYEGCTSSIVFTRADVTNTSSPISVSYTMSGSATNGTDYSSLSGSATIPSGETSVTVPVVALNDASTEGEELIILTVNSGGCPCSAVTLKDTIKLRDYTDVTANIVQADQAVCSGTSLALTSSATGNLLQYTWHSGSLTGPILTHNANYTTPALASAINYYLVVKDSCGNTASDNIHITISANSSIPTSATATPATICNGESSSLEVVGGTLGSGADWHWYKTNCGTGAVGTGSPLSVSPTGTTTYYVRAEGTCNTTGCVNVTVTVNQPVTVDAGTPQTICSSSTVTLAGSIGGSASSATWSGGTGTYNPDNTTLNAVYTPTAAEIAAGTVTLTLTTNDPAGPCPALSDDVTITINSAATVDAGAPQTICGGSTVTLAGVIGGGASSATWSGGGGTYNPNNTTLNAVYTPSAAEVTAGTVNLILTTDNPSGPCNAVNDNVTITINPIPTVDAGAPQTICSDGTVTLTGSIGGGASSATWSGGTGTYNPDNTTLNAIYTPSSTEITAGTVTLTLTTDDPSGPCGAVNDNVTITINPLPTVDAGAPQTICANSTVTLAGSIGGGASSATWSGGAGTYNPNNTTLNAVYTPSSTEITAGTVTLTLTTDDPTGPCGSVNDNVTITIYPLPTVDAGVPQTICADQTVTLAGSIGGAATSASWSGGTGTYNPNNTTLNAVYTPSSTEIATGTVTLTLTTDDPAGPCGAVSDNVIITINPLPTLYSVTGGGQYCSGSSGVPVGLDGSQVGISYQLYLNGSPVGLPVAGTGAAISFGNQTAAGTYTVIATNTTTNCDVNVTGSATVVINPLPVANAGADFSIPHGISTSLTGSATGGSGSYNYSWTPVDSLVDPNAQNPNTYNLYSTTEFILTVTDSLGCIDTDTIIVTITGDSLNISSLTATDDTICYGESTQLQALGSGGSGVYTYSWTSVPAGFTSSAFNPTVSPATTTMYIITLDDGYNTVVDTINITVNPLPLVYVVSGGGSYCGGTATGVNVCLSLSQLGVSYQLQCNGTNIGTPLAGTGAALCFNNQTVAGTYTIVATNVTTLCVNTMSGSTTVSINNPPVANAGSDATIPYGTSTTLNGSATGGSGSYSYSWSPVGSLVNPTNQNPTTTNLYTNTTYTLTVLDWATGCSGTDQVNILLSGVPINISSISATPSSICLGTSTQLSAVAAGGNGTYTYAWTSNPIGFTSNIANPVVSPTVTTTYTVVANDSYNTASASITVTVNPIPVAHAGSDTTICLGFSLNLNATGAGVGGSYAWSPATYLSATNIYNPVTTPASAITYVVTVTDINGCSSTDDINITLFNTEQVNAGIDHTICNGHEAQLNASGGDSFIWTPVSTLSSATISNPIATPAITTTYTVIATDKHGCTSMDNVVVNVNPDVAVTTSNDTTICSGSSINISASGGTDYIWSPASGLSSTTIANPIANPQITTTYYVTVSNTYGCSDVADVIITVKESPVVNAGSDVIICNGNSIQLHASGGDSYLWLPDNYLSSNTVADPISTPPITTTYVVTTISINGCSGSDDITVNVNALPTIDAGQAVTICKYQSTTLVATGGSSYTWDNGIANNSITVHPILNTIYTVTGTDINGCTNTDNVAVTVLNYEPPVITPDGPVFFCDNDPIDVNLISTTGYSSYLWNNGSISSSIHVTTAGAYYCEGAYTNGCSDTSNVIIVGNYPSPDAPIIIADGPINFCENDSVAVNLSTSVLYNYYNWSTGSVTPSVHATHAGFYWVTVTDVHGCSSVSIDPLEITFTPLPVVYFNYGSNGLYYEFFNFSLNGNSYLWYFGDGTTSTLENPTHTYTDYGTYPIVLAVTNMCGTSLDTVWITVNTGAGIDENEPVDNLTIYPIPTKDLLFMSFETYNSDIDFSIVNILGQELYKESLGTINGKYKKVIDMMSYPTGVYFLRIKSEKGIINKKIVVN
ncbi:MAG TPA: choice-of-anchor L domain-containing protein, partial [Bacteroidales bacterium]|nr:choice-of-anchor L domain-containing protein [Bacteroidales bacterium]